MKSNKYVPWAAQALSNQNTTHLVVLFAVTVNETFSFRKEGKGGSTELVLTLQLTPLCSSQSLACLESAEGHEVYCNFG